jgi:hypothetical protein
MSLCSFRRKLTTIQHHSRPHAPHDPSVHFYSEHAIYQSVRAGLVIVAVLMLIVPMFILYYITATGLRLGLIAFFSAVFALAVALGTECRNYEVFTVLAA